MEISKKKLLLVPVERGKKSLAPEERVFVRVNEGNGQLAIGSRALEAMGGQNMLYRMFYDTANTVIAWQFKDGLDKEEMQSKTWKAVNPAPSNGIFVVSIRRVLEVLGRGKGGSYKAEVKKSLMRGDLMQDGDYFFIDLLEATSKAV